MTVAPRPAPAWALVPLVALAVVLAHAIADMQVFGLARDDGEYAAYARALAWGLGYVDPSLPEAPPAARFPIGLPALAALWGLGTSGEDQLARLLWLAPCALGAYLVAAYAVFRRVGGLAAGWALGLTALLALDADVVTGAGWLSSDLVFGALGLGTALAWAAGRPLTAGTLAGVACLVRSAGLAFVPALAFAAWWARDARAGAAGLAPVALIAGGWALWRTGSGGASYASVFWASLPTDAPGWLAAGGTVAQRVLGVSIPELVAPGLLESGGPLGWLASGVVLVGLGRMWAGPWGPHPARGGDEPRPEPPSPRAAWRGDAAGAGEPRGMAFGAAFAGATLVLAVGWDLSQHALEAELVTRLLIPVAPWLLLAFVVGARALAAGRLPARAAAVALAIALLFAAYGLRHPVGYVLQPGPARAAQADWAALFAAVRARTPADARLISPFGVATWLHTGRQGYTWPVALRPSGQTPIDAATALGVLADRHVAFVVAAPDPLAGPVPPAVAAAFPGVLVPVWSSPDGRHALLAVSPAALARARAEARR